MSFKLALIQMRLEAGNKTLNLRHASELISAAASQGAQMVLLPEAMPLGWTDPSARTQADEIPHGESFRCLQEAACRNRLYVCSGILEKDRRHIFNTAVLIDPTGAMVLHHRKLNELEIAHDLYAQGDRLQVAHTALGTLGIMICSDAFARGQIISRTLGLMGADVILSPCAWAVSADHDQYKDPYGELWRDNYQPVARDFRLWIAGVSNVGCISEGPWAGRRCIGCSMVVGPSGEVVLQGPYGHEAETILYVSIDIERRPARGMSWQDRWLEKAS